MSTFSDAYEVTAADRTGKGVTGLPDTPGYPQLPMQQQFDSLANLSITKFNAMVNAAETSITSSDTNFPTSKAAKDYADGVGASVKAAVEAEIIQSDWNQADNTKTDYIKNKPTALSQFSEDSTHRLVSDTEKSTWNGKQNALTFDNSPTSGSNNPVKSGGIYTDGQNIYKVMGKNGAKNILPMTVSGIKAVNTGGTWSGDAYTINGVTYTIITNDSGAITGIKVNGTASSNADFKFDNYDFNSNTPYIPAGTYIASTNGNVNLIGGINAVRDFTATTSTTFTSASGLSFVLLRVNSGSTINNVVVYPMLRLASDTDSTYQPYAKTNQELTSDVSSINTTLAGKQNTLTFDNVPTSSSSNPVKSGGVYSAENDIYKSIGINGTKNRLPLTLANLKTANTGGTWAENVYTQNSVVYTVNQDSNGNVISIKATGSVSGGANSLNIPFNWVANTPYIFNGCPSGGSSNSYRIDVYDETDTLVANIFDYGTGNTYTPSASGTGKLRIRFANGYTIPADGLMFYPQIRLASDTDSTYQPYAMTNKELTESVVPVETQATDILTGASTESGINSIVKVGKMVFTDIYLQNLTCPASTTLCVIPTSYRPKYDITIPVWSNVSAGFVTLVISASNGTVQAVASLNSNKVRLALSWVTN